METRNIFFNNKYKNNFDKSLNIEKPKSLKDQHFEKYYNHLFGKMGYSSNIKTFSLTECSTNEKKYQNKQKSVNSSFYQPVVIKRNFKNPKNINYKLLKFNPYKTYLAPKTNSISNDLKNIKKIKKKKIDKINIKDINSISFYDIKFKKIKEKPNKSITETNENIKNKKFAVINYIINKEEYNDLVNKIKKYNDKKKKKRIKTKIYYDNNVREGYFGQKDTVGIPIFYDTSTIFKNEYANKSEKNRHEMILNELNKLKTYLVRQPEKQLFLIKDFLNKFHMEEIEKYNNRQLLNLCNFIIYADNEILARCLKPYLNIKNMLYDILNNSLGLHNLYLEEKEQNKNNRNDESNFVKTDTNNYKNKSKNIIGQKILENSYKEINAPPKDLINKEKYYLSPLINRKRLKYMTQSIKVDKIYKNKISLNEEKNDNNNYFENNSTKRKSTILDLNSTNSKLKYMIYQKESFNPYKSFSNNNTIIKEIGKEIKDIENDFNEKLKELELMKNNDSKKNSIIFSSRNTVNIEMNDKLYVNIRNNKNTRLKTFVPIHYTETKNYNGEFQNLNDIIENDNELLNSENKIYRKRFLSLDNCYLNSTERNKEKNEKKESYHKKREGSLNKVKNPKNDTDVIRRLYYIPTRKKFGLQEIRNRLKLTEYIALTHAKNKIYKNKII